MKALIVLSTAGDQQHLLAFEQHTALLKRQLVSSFAFKGALLVEEVARYTPDELETLEQEIGQASLIIGLLTPSFLAEFSLVPYLSFLLEEAQRGRGA